MSSARRLEKISRIIQQTVSAVIQNELSDPRIAGMTSVTRVETAPDLRSAKVHLSIFGIPVPKAQLCLQAIQHAHGYIQSRLAEGLTMRTLPTLTFHLDESIKRGFTVLQLLDQVAAERREKEQPASSAEPDQPEPRHEG
jgi:ribosome-binding factor A